MSNKERILQMIKKIEEYLVAIEKMRPVSIEKLKKDLFYRSALERLLYLSCDSLISILEMLIALRDYQTATTYSENAYILNDKNELSDEQVEQIIQMIGFRNVLTHDYTKLDLGIIADIANQEIDDLKNILEDFKVKL